MAAYQAGAEDELELVTGTRVRGKLLERTEQSIRFEISVENRPLTRIYPVNRVQAIIRDGRREVLGSTSGTNVASAGSTTTTNVTSGVDEVIEKMGRTPPSWFETTLLEYPKTLDLTWPEPAPKIWNYTRNVDHYLWDIISSNPKRYQAGVRLMHHLLVVNQANEPTRLRVMNELGRMYFEFFRDYARAAFWWRQAKVTTEPRFVTSSSPARLAECYWRLGDRARAVELLEGLPLTPAIIKAWGDLKETAKALELCESALKQGLEESEVHLLAGDACRSARDFTRATSYYQKALEVPARGERTEEIKRNHERANETLEVIRLFDTLDVAVIPDGEYSGRSRGYAGDVEIKAVVNNRRIESIEVVHHSDRQYYHAIDETIRRIVGRQSVNGVDAISGATVTSEAVIRASAKALADGMAAKAGAK